MSGLALLIYAGAGLVMVLFTIGSIVMFTKDPEPPPTGVAVFAFVCFAVACVACFAMAAHVLGGGAIL